MALGEDIAKRYHALWEELTEDLVVRKDEAYLIRQRLDTLQSLGFVVDDFSLEPADDGQLVSMKVSVASRTYHADRLNQLTGLEASETQARVLLNDLAYYQAKHGTDTETGRLLAAIDWLKEGFEPYVELILAEWPDQDPVQRFCDFPSPQVEDGQGQGPGHGQR